ncbi:alpha-2A adrenergic receptor-like [Liolophura sinensis]|uniref:alpha-2A adrenergic receptor-like n=1 Tax=Liolophura sinensis TaxID=3198878 RepID=UPI0031591161
MEKNQNFSVNNSWLGNIWNSSVAEDNELPPYTLAFWTLGQKVGIVAGFGLLIALTILGNMTIIVAVLKDPVLKSSVTNLFYVSLALADVLVGFLVVPLMLLFVYLGYWPLGYAFCDAWLSVDFLCCTASFYTLTAISWDRYRAVSCPLNHLTTRSRRRVILTLVGVWVAAALVWVPAISVVRYLSGLYVDYYCLFVTSPEYVMVSCIIAYYIPAAAMVILYALIYKNVRHALNSPVNTDATNCHNNTGFPSQKIDYGNTTRSQEGKMFADSYGKLYRNESGSEVSVSIVSLSMTNTAASVSQTSMSDCGETKSKSRRHIRERESRSEKQRRTMVTLGVVMAVFLVSWCPWMVIWPVASYWPDNVPQWLYDLSAMAAYINSLLNPFLYVFSNPAFRAAVKRILTGRKNFDQTF